jgi:hypothetical protein
LARYTGNGSNTLQRHRFMTLEAKGRKARIRIVDHANGPRGHLSEGVPNFGGIYKEAPPIFIR